MNLENRSVFLWIGVMFFTIAGLLVGVEVGRRADLEFLGVLGGLLGIGTGFCIGVLAAQWALRR